MSRETWRLLKQSKRFYVNTYRRAGSALIVSIIINLALGFAIHFVYFSQSERDYYATNGATPPIMLTPMDVPNNTSVALLASDLENENDARVIPQ